jgi:nucleotide-binding universal stress UspA family protein
MPMNTPQRLLVPIDFSDITEPVIDAAIEVATPFAATITLMHAYVVPMMPYGGPFAPVMDQIRAAAREQLETVVERTKQRYPRCDCKLLGGAIEQQILRAADEVRADWIVIGSRGLSGLSRLMLGSIAERVVRLSPLPVLVVTPKGNVVTSRPAGSAA